jgi:hypothetical protein
VDDVEGAVEGWGWLEFSAIVLIVAGVMRIFDAVWAWRFDGVVPEEFRRSLFGDDLDAWGWVWFTVGIVLIVAGAVITRRAQWARWVGVVAGAGLAISAVWAMPMYPVWSLVYIAFGIMVIYGLVSYGGRSPARAG